MNAFDSMSDSGFAIIFSAIILMAAIPTALEFWQKVQRCNSDTLLKREMLIMGASADEIVRSLLARSAPDSRSNQT